MSINDHDEDYVLVPKRKAKISRARRLVIGIMAIGAVAAVANAGTFASFSASTTNDGAFKTGRLVLSNTNPSATSCLSDASAANGTAEDAANLDSNDQACGALFSSNLKPGDTATALITIANKGTETADLYLSASTPGCVSTTNVTGKPAGTGDICGRIELLITKTSDTTTPATNGCLYPSTGTTCADFNPAKTYTDFGTNKQFTNKITAGTSMAPNDSQDYLVVVHMKKTTTGNHNVTGNACDANGFDTNGIGCDNLYQNKKANLTLRWLLQA
jgi:predicted ribosomally synthesized peptide with SipW-like signal peptide